MVSINKDAGGEFEEGGGDRERDAILKVKTFWIETRVLMWAACR